jgi:hypothetical protein
VFSPQADGASQCSGQTFLGRKQAHGIAVKLYNSDRKNENVEQKNFLIFPLELSRAQCLLNFLRP